MPIAKRIEIPMFPNGKRLAFTTSWDDGTIHDRQMVALLNSFGIKGTYNLNSGLFGPIAVFTTGSRLRKSLRFSPATRSPFTRSRIPGFTFWILPKSPSKSSTTVKPWRILSAIRFGEWRILSGLRARASSRCFARSASCTAARLDIRTRSGLRSNRFSGGRPRIFWRMGLSSVSKPGTRTRVRTDSSMSGGTRMNARSARTGTRSRASSNPCPVKATSGTRRISNSSTTRPRETVWSSRRIAGAPTIRAAFR